METIDRYEAYHRWRENLETMAPSPERDGTIANVDKLIRLTEKRLYSELTGLIEQRMYAELTGSIES